MAFQRLDRAPQPAQYIDVFHERDKIGATQLAIPALGLIARERLRWRKLGRGHEADTLVGKIATSLTAHLNDVIRAREAVAEATEYTNIFHSGLAEAITKWYSEAAVVLPYAKMLRDPDMFDALTDERVIWHDGKQQIMPDYDDDELDRSGLHVSHHALAKIRGFEPQAIGEEVWYEGDEIFVRARAPAEQTLNLNATYRSNGMRFDRTAHVTLAPRTKTEVWMGDGA